MLTLEGKSRGNQNERLGCQPITPLDFGYFNFFLIVLSFEQKDTVRESWFRTLFIKPKGGMGTLGKKSKGGRGGGQRQPGRGGSFYYLLKMLILETSSG